MEKIIFTKSEKETKSFAERLAKRIIQKKPKNKAFVVGLEGDLGGGKTTFLQGFARGLGIKQRITSPTFIIIRRFTIHDSRFTNFYHIDCYRISKPKELLALGFKEIISDYRNIVAVEWADRVRKIMPGDAARLRFKFIDNKTRKIVLK